ncbi:MAG: 4Fe-4S cluster-binding domain-containing protein [Caldithrix sp.]|nr:4Fe-4S cluster-binding domain-containing protein [Caldithrix sp.]
MFYTIKRFLRSSYADKISSTEKAELQYLTKVFPFKVSEYVLEELIDWAHRDSDPIYKLTFPRRDMLSDEHWKLLTAAKSLKEEREAVARIRHDLNPHPANQKDNIPSIGDRLFGGIQHKYKETVLFFPAQGQTCHSYCTYCFRWAQFVNLEEHKFKSKEQTELFDYLAYNKGVTDVLFTGGDPLWMSNSQLIPYLNTMIEKELQHVKNIRIGTKALAFHPERFLDEEGDVLMKKFESLQKAGKKIALMAHFSHEKELQTKKVIKAAERLKNAGVIIRTQAPLIKGINDSGALWRDMWITQVNLGMVPYYMFIERDTGAHEYFAVPLARAYQIFTEAYSQVSGLAKTVRGPSMSTDPGKVLVDGIISLGGEKKFLLKLIQSRKPELINIPFYADFDMNATWLDELNINPPWDAYLDGSQQFDREELNSIHEVA